MKPSKNHIQYELINRILKNVFLRNLRSITISMQSCNLIDQNKRIIAQIVSDKYNKL